MKGCIDNMKTDYNVIKFAEFTGQLETPDWSQTGELLKVYKVPINKLYYNDDNGRIATWISSYSDLDNQKPISEMEIEEYNSRLQKFVKESNSPESYKKTFNDIKLKGQIRPGVVLTDGRVVSGNRRLTVLRELYEETFSDKYAFFKCFILDKDLDKEEDRKYIKTIERLTQFGVDEKVDYDPIDRLVDIYNDLVGPRKIFTMNEYSKKLGLKMSEVELMYNKAVVMADYLKYNNTPNKFYLAKKQKLDGPLQELSRLYKKVSNDHEWNRIRIVFYACFAESGDTTRVVRELIKVYNKNSSEFDKLIAKCITDIEQKEEENIGKNILLNEESSGYVSTGKVDKNKSPDEVKPVLSDRTKKEIFDITNKNKIEIKRLDKVSKIFQSIDTLVLSITDTIKVMNDDEKATLRSKINDIEKVIEHIKGE